MVATSRALPGAVSAALQRFARLLRERFGERVVELVLFGSRARGDAHDDSDVDVLVVIDDLTEQERLTAIDLAFAAAGNDQAWVELAPLVYTAAEAAKMRRGGRRLFRDIDGEGIRL